MSDLKKIPRGLTKTLSREHVAYLTEMGKKIDEKLDDQNGLTGIYNFGGVSPGDVKTMTFTNGVLTGVTTI